MFASDLKVWDEEFIHAGGWGSKFRTCAERLLCYSAACKSLLAQKAWAKLPERCCQPVREPQVLSRFCLSIKKEPSVRLFFCFFFLQQMCWICDGRSDIFGWMLFSCEQRFWIQVLKAKESEWNRQLSIAFIFVTCCFCFRELIFCVSTVVQNHVGGGWAHLGVICQQKFQICWDVEVFCFI